MTTYATITDLIPRERGHVRERIAEHEPVVFGQHHPILPAASAPRRIVSDDATA